MSNNNSTKNFVSMRSNFVLLILLLVIYSCLALLNQNEKYNSVREMKRKSLPIIPSFDVNAHISRWEAQYEQYESLSTSFSAERKLSPSLTSNQIMVSLSSLLSGAVPSWNVTLSGDACFNATGGYYSSKWDQVSCFNDQVVTISLGASNAYNLAAFTLQDIDLISNLPMLSYLDLSVTGIGGYISSSFDRLNIAYFDVSYNNIIGPLPITLSNWTSCNSFFVNNNQINGSLPNEYGNMINMVYFFVHANAITGSLPPSFSNWKYVQRIWVLQNQISGIIPPEYESMIYLLDFQAYDNMINGTLPSSLSYWKSIQYFKVNQNRISGSIPFEYGNMINMLDFEANNNMITGPIPTSLSNWVLCQIFILYNNFVNGTISPFLANMVSMNTFDVHSNNITGIIPPEIGKGWGQNLTGFYINYNNMTGPIPESLSAWINIVIFGINDNNFIGTLPPIFGEKWSMVSSFSVSRNHFVGCIPSSYDNMSAMISFGATGNLLTEPLPLLPSWTSIVNFYVSKNQIKGPVPKFDSWTKVEVIYLNNNLLQGQIIWKNMSSLTTLDASYNQLDGVLSDYSFPTNLETLSLNNNNIKGTFDPLLLPSSLEFFNLSNNQLNGPLSFANLGKTVYQVDLSNNAYKNVALSVEDFTLSTSREGNNTLVIHLERNPSFLCPFPGLNEINFANEKINAALDLVLFKDACDTDYLGLAKYGIAFGIIIMAFLIIFILYIIYKRETEISIVGLALWLLSAISCIYLCFVKREGETAVTTENIFLWIMGSSGKTKDAKTKMQSNIAKLVWLILYLIGIYHHIQMGIVYLEMHTLATTPTIDNCIVMNNKPLWKNKMILFFNGGSSNLIYPDYSCHPFTSDICAPNYSINLYSNFSTYYNLLLEGRPQIDFPSNVQSNLQIFISLCEEFVVVNNVTECAFNSANNSCFRAADGTAARRALFESFLIASIVIVVVKEALKCLAILHIIRTRVSAPWIRLFVRLSFLAPLLAFRINFVHDIIKHESSLGEFISIFIADGVLEGVNELAIICFYSYYINQTGISAFAFISMGMNVAGLAHKTVMIMYNVYKLITKKTKVEHPNEIEMKNDVERDTNLAVDNPLSSNDRKK